MPRFHKLLVFSCEIYYVYVDFSGIISVSFLFVFSTCGEGKPCFLTNLLKCVLMFKLVDMISPLTPTKHPGVLIPTTSKGLQYPEWTQ